MQQTRAVFPRHALQSFKASKTKRYSQNCLQKATGFINKIETRTVDIGYDFTSLFPQNGAPARGRPPAKLEGKG